jgi:hypothetical protein
MTSYVSNVNGSAARGAAGFWLFNDYAVVRMDSDSACPSACTFGASMML